MLRNSFVFLDGVGERLEKNIWHQGVLDWKDFREKDDIDGIGKIRKRKFDNFIKKAEKNLEKSNKKFFSYQFPSKHYWRLFKEFSDDVAYIDIETTGLDFSKNKVTVVGIYDGESSSVFVYGDDLNTDNLQKELDKHSILVSFNGKRFDIPFLKQKFPDLTFDHPHIDLMYGCRRIGLSGGLKNIEKCLNIQRTGDGKDVDGREAVRLWKRFERSNDKEALHRLVEYNKKDIKNLKPLMEHVYKSLKTDCFGKCISS